MRIVFLRSNPVDPDSRVEKEVNALVNAGYKVEIIAWDRNATYKLKESYLELNSGKVKIHRFGIMATFGGGIKSNLKPLINFQLQLLKWLFKNRNKFDIIHACDFDTAYTAFRFSKLFKKKLVYDIFDYYIESFRVPIFLKTFIKSKDHNIINSADAVIICSEKRKEQIKGTNPRRLVIVHNTPAFNSNIKKLDLDESKIKIVYVGILANGRFIKEIAEIIKDNSIYEFHIGGFGKLERYFKDLSTKQSNVIFYGKLPYKKTLELENSCDIMSAIYDPSIPNHYYAAPNKFYEALMLGKPVIMAKNTGMDSVVSKNDIGGVIEYNENSLRTVIESLVNRKAEWPKISNKMKCLYDENYSWSEMEDRLLGLYQEVSSS